MTIDEIEAQMNNDTAEKGVYDFEHNHEVADKLLVDLIRLLATDENKEQVDRILKRYADIFKVYSF